METIVPTHNTHQIFSILLVLNIFDLEMLPQSFKVMMDRFRALFTPWCEPSLRDAAKICDMIENSMQLWCHRQPQFQVTKTVQKPHKLCIVMITSCPNFKSLRLLHHY